ncbi:MAG: IS66 family insertion sequence element accessory protein TnpB [Culicoidibacterales bacterium]
MLVNFSNAKHIFIVCGHTDMRRGIDGLANIITEQYNLDLFQEDAIFLFCGRRRDRYKVLHWDRDGFALLYKRIEDGNLQWPRDLYSSIKKCTTCYENSRPLLLIKK